MSDVLVETAVFQVFANRQLELDLLIIGKKDTRWNTHELKDYMLKFETDVHAAIKAAYQAWYLTEHEIERKETGGTLLKEGKGE